MPEIVGGAFVPPVGGGACHPPEGRTVPLAPLTALMSLAAPAVICVSAGANAADAPVGSACVTAAGSMPEVSPPTFCSRSVNAADGVIAFAAATPLRAASIIPAVIGNVAVGDVVRRVASWLIALSKGPVAG